MSFRTPTPPAAFGGASQNLTNHDSFRKKPQRPYKYRRKRSKSCLFRYFCDLIVWLIPSCLLRLSQPSSQEKGSGHQRRNNGQPKQCQLVVSRPFGKCFLVMSRLRNALQDIILCLMQTLFLWSSIISPLPPSPGSFFERAYIKYSVTQVFDNFRIRFFPEERLVCMYSVACQKGSLRFWHILLYIFEEVGRGLFGSDC